MKNRSDDKSGYLGQDPRRKGQNEITDQTDRKAFNSRRDPEEELEETDSGYMVMTTSEILDFTEGTDGEE